MIFFVCRLHRLCFPYDTDVWFMISFLFYNLTNIFYFLYCLYKLGCFEDEWNSNYGTRTSIFLFTYYITIVSFIVAWWMCFSSVCFTFFAWCYVLCYIFCFLSLLPYFDYWRAYAIFFRWGSSCLFLYVFSPVLNDLWFLLKLIVFI